MENKEKLKFAVKALVENKVELTRKRYAYRDSSRGVESEDARRITLGDMDRERWYEKNKIRHTLMAYAFVRRMPYARVERNCDELPLISFIVDCADKAGVALQYPEVEAWLNGVPFVKTQAAE